VIVSPKPLDLTKLRQVIARLHEAVAVYQGEPANEFYLDSVIKRFEYTFEVSRKVLRRFLVDCDPEVAKIPANDLHRFVELGVEQGLLKSDWMVWRQLRDARNITAHDYGEEKAHEVAKSAAPMLEEAIFLLNALKPRIPQEGDDGES
jgi:nucleotidyltransferase substrate binding protein (TIGR01987 family)